MAFISVAIVSFQPRRAVYARGVRRWGETGDETTFSAGHEMLGYCSYLIRVRSMSLCLDFSFQSITSLKLGTLQSLYASFQIQGFV